MTTHRQISIKHLSLIVIIALVAASCGANNEYDPLGGDYESAAEQLTAEFNGAYVDPVAINQVLEISKRLTLETRSAGILNMVNALKENLTKRGIDGSVLSEIEDFTIGQPLPGVGEYIEAEPTDGVSSTSHALAANNPNLEHFECPLVEKKGTESCVQIVDAIMKQVKRNIDTQGMQALAQKMVEEDPAVNYQSQEFKDYALQYLDDLALDIHTFGIEMAAIRAEYTLRDAQLCDNRVIDGTEIARLRGIMEAETILRDMVKKEGLTLAPKGKECLCVGKAGGEAEAKIERAIQTFLKESEAEAPMCPDMAYLNESVQIIREARLEGIERGIKAHTATIWVTMFRNGDFHHKERQIIVKIDGCNAKDQITYTTSPLVLDLDGDGLELSTDRVRFDLRATGEPQQVTWASKSEGFLALDLNGDGRITSGRELFGNRSLCHGDRCSDGAAALALHDTTERGGNADGRIDAKDEVFSELKVWVDRNQDGRSQSDELAGLGDHGVQSISLKVNPMDQRVPGGRLSLSLDVKTDRGSLSAYDVWFDNLTSPGFPSPLH